MPRSLIMVLMLCFAGFIGCSQDEAAQEENETTDDDNKLDTWGDQSDPEENSNAVVIGESGDGQTFEVVVGQDVVVRLSSNPSTGYSWEVISTDRTFGYPTSDEYIGDEPEAVGSGGYQELIWVPGGALPMVGSHTVVLGYKRSSEEGEPEQTFTFTVNIVEAGADPVEPDDDAVYIDDSGNEGAFDIIEGQDVVVQLSSNPTTGYSWEVISTDRTFGYPASDEYVGDDSGAVGSGGYQELIWVTGGVLPMAGSHTVVLGYKRSFEEGEPEQTFTFTVNIIAE